MRSTSSLHGIRNIGMLLIIIGLLVGGLIPFVSGHITHADEAEKQGVRFASFNASLNRSQAGELITDLSTPDNEQAQTVAEIIQRTAPDVLLINEFDYDENGEAADLFRINYLEVSQNGAEPIEYPYVYVAPSNTGIPSGFNLDNDPEGTTDSPNDAFGFGFFPGQFGMVLYSTYPIDTENVRTFQTFLWADMPDALLPDDPDTPEPADWFSPEELDVVRLSSKSHWDVPIDVDGTIMHALVSHPTPPVFDGPEDRNGRRNHDEIRFWSDYVTPGLGDYIYDDSGETGGLAPGARFVIMGDQNADPFDGDSTDNAILQLLNNPLVNTSLTPSSEGAVEQSMLQGGANTMHEGNPAFDTADFSDSTPGNLRVDYVLPSRNLGITHAGVFWPLSDDPLFDLVGVFDPEISGFPSSDHRLVWADVLPENTLANGIAAGDATPTSVVLWTRSTETGEVTFEYATDAAFGTVLGTETATVSDPTLPVKVEIDGLSPGTEYYYRVTDAAGTTAVGRFETPAETGTRTGLRFGVVGDWQEPPPYPSIVNVDERDLDFFVQHSDNIYADTLTPGVPEAGEQARTLEEFRAKYDEVMATRLNFNTMMDLRASTSILATIDDHELTDNFAGGAPPAQGSNSKADVFAEFVGDFDYTNDTPIYENALQAFQEYQPLYDEFYADTGSDPRMDGERKLYRSRTYGDDAAVFITDPRSFRDAQLPAVGDPTDPEAIAEFLAATYTPDRTMLGQRQLEQLQQDLLQAQEDGVIWKFVFVSEPVQNFGVINAEDRFEGYAAERTALLQFIDENEIDNVVFVAADFHGTVVNDLTYQVAPQIGPGQPQYDTGAFEVIVGPVAFFSGTFGPAVIELAEQAGLISPEERELYESLPMAEKDAFLTELLNAQVVPLGYSPVGLQDSEIDATLLEGGYVAAHKYGWTEFEIDQLTQQLTVTTYGIDIYPFSEFEENPGSVLTREPRILSQFEVKPTNFDAASNTLTLLHNNDGESGLLPTTSTVEDNGSSLEVPVGGIAAFSSVAEREIDEAQEAGHSTVMVYAGDAFLASATIQCSLDPGEPIYDAIGQRQIPYDAHALGNHEFDYTPDFLKRFIEAFDDGSGLDQPFLSANLDFSGEAGLSNINELVDEDGLLELPITDGNVIGGSVIVTDEVTGQEFGIVGVTTPFLDSISSPRNVTVEPDTVAVVQAEIDRLINEQGVNRIILVSHLQDVDNDQELIAQLVGVDVAVAGGGDDFLLNSDIPEDIQRLPGDDGDREGEYPLEVTDAAGRTVYVVTGTDRYRYLGRLDVVFDDEGEVLGVVSENSYPRRVLPESDAAETLGVTDAVVPDAEIVSTVNEPVQACLDELGEEAIATTEILLDVSRDGVRGGENNTGNLVADAFIYAYDKYNENIDLPDPSADNPVVAIQNGGGIRQNAGDVLPRSGTVPGPITVLDTIDVLPFLNFISVVEEVSPQELLDEIGNVGTSGIYHVSNLRLEYGTVEEESETRYVIDTITLINPDGSETTLVEDGAVVTGAPNVTVVTNSFVADREFEDNPNQTLLEDDQGVRLVYEQPLREYLQDPVEQGALGGLIAEDDPRYQPGGEGRIVISDEPPDMPQPQPGDGFAFQCEARMLNIAGEGVSGNDDLSIVVPDEAGWSYVQLGGAGFFREPPLSATFDFADNSTVTLQPTAIIDEMPLVAPGGIVGYTFETEGVSGEVMVTLEEGEGRLAHPEALVTYYTTPADEEYSAAGATTLQYTWGGDNGGLYVGPTELALTLPEALTSDTNVTVRVVVMGKDVQQGSDQRIAVVRAEAGDVVAETTLNNPDAPRVNVVELTLEGVPAGTDTVNASVISPLTEDKSQWNNPDAGDSVFMLGATAVHPCDTTNGQ